MRSSIGVLIGVLFVLNSSDIFAIERSAGQKISERSTSKQDISEQSTSEQSTSKLNSKYKLYDITNSVNSYMYYIKEVVENGKVIHQWEKSKNEVDETWSISFKEHNLVKAEEVQDAEGRYYLRVPYGDPPGDDIKNTSEIPYFLIPEFPNGQRVWGDKIKNASYQLALPGKKNTGAILTDREDNIVYPDLPYQEKIPLLEDPEVDSRDCIVNKSGPKCKAWLDSQNELKVVDTKIKIAKALDSKQEKMELYYKVESESKQRGKISKVQGWVPVQRLIDFKREPTTISETVSERTAELIRKIKKKLKPQSKENCGLKKSIIGTWPDDISAVIEQASHQPIDNDDIGVCRGADHIKKMDNSDLKVEGEYEKKIADAEKRSSKNDALVLKLEHKKNKERLKKLGETWTSSKNPFDFYIRDYWDEKYKNDKATKSNKAISKDQMLSIDSLARSLYGEMRKVECSGDTSSYYKEIARVMLNRAAVVKQKNGPVESFISAKSLKEFDKVGGPKNASVFAILPHVISSPSQISSWNTNDDNLRENLCPDPKNHKASIAALELAKAVAVEVVMDTKTFLDETRDMAPALFYVSDMTPYWESDKSYVQYNDVQIHLNLADPVNKNSVNVYTQKVNNPNCVKLYRNTNYSDEIRVIKKDQTKFYTKY